jgi:hypothetical protein
MDWLLPFSVVIFFVGKLLTDHWLKLPAEPNNCGESEKRAMDTTKLVVGQEVYMFCGAECYGFAKGEVVKITSAGVEVKSGELWGLGRMEIGSELTGRGIRITSSVVDTEFWGQESRRMEEIGIVRFDNNGIELEADRRKRHGFEPGPDFSHDRFMQSVWYGAPECGPWQLDDMPFEERTAKIEERAALSEYYGRVRKLMVVGREAWMISGPCSLKGKVVKITEAETETREGKMVITTAASIEVQELPSGELRRFYYCGTQLDGRHHPDFGPWQLHDRPFEECTAPIAAAMASVRQIQRRTLDCS